MKYKITNPLSSIRKFRNRQGQIVVVEPKGTVISDIIPEGQWKVEKTDNEKSSDIAESSDIEQLKRIKGVDYELADTLIRRFGDINGIKNAGFEAILDIPGIGKKRAEKILKSLEEGS